MAVVSMGRVTRRRVSPFKGMTASSLDGAAVSFSRASHAFDPSQLLENRLWPSQDLSNAQWAKANVTITTSTTVNDGTATAIHETTQPVSSLMAGTTSRVTVRVQRVNAQYFGIALDTNYGDYTNRSVIFDILNGTVARAPSGLGISGAASITLVSAGVYDVEFSWTQTTVTSATIRLMCAYAADGSGTSSGTEINRAGLNNARHTIIRAQFQEGAGAYLQTTTEGLTRYMAGSNVLRSRTVGAETVLTRETASTTLVRNTRPTSGDWGKNNGVTITPDAIDGPFGTATTPELRGYKMVEGATLGNQFMTHSNIALNVSTKYTYSIYAKAAERSRLIIEAAASAASMWTEGADQFGSAAFDLTNGTVVAGYPWAAYARISDAGNGWWLCELTLTVAAAAVSPSTNYVVYMYNGTSQNYAGTAGWGYYVWGPQFEAGQTATSRILNTSGTSRARAVDLIDLAGFNNNTSDRGWLVAFKPARLGVAYQQFFGRGTVDTAVETETLRVRNDSILESVTSDGTTTAAEYTVHGAALAGDHRWHVAGIRLTSTGLTGYRYGAGAGTNAAIRPQASLTAYDIGDKPGNADDYTGELIIKFATAPSEAEYQAEAAAVRSTLSGATERIAAGWAA